MQAGFERVAPMALLYLQHWHGPIAAAAHALTAALVENAAQVGGACAQLALSAVEQTLMVISSQLHFMIRHAPWEQLCQALIVGVALSTAL